MSAEEIKDTYNLNLDNQVDKDVLLFEVKFHKGVKQLAKRKKCVLRSKAQESRI